MKTKYKRNTSRRATPWDKMEELTPLQDFIKSRYIEAYDVRHPPIKGSKEVDLLNTYPIFKCKHCGSLNIQKRGYTATGIQRYYCNDCKHTFSILTNTIFENRKISISEWIEYCLDLFRYESLNVTSKTNKNANTTTKYWLMKLFLLLEDYQDNIILSGNVYIDETYYPVIESDKTIIDGKKLRGLSKNQYCIGVGYDGKNVYASLEGLGKTSKEKTKTAFINHIAEGSHLIHDKEKSHKILVDQLNLTENKYDAKQCKKISDPKNPLNPINQQCRLLKLFLNSHSSFNRCDIQNYLNLFCFIMNPPVDKLKKVEKLLNVAIYSDKTLKYREAFKTKSS